MIRFSLKEKIIAPDFLLSKHDDTSSSSVPIHVTDTRSCSDVPLLIHMLFSLPSVLGGKKSSSTKGKQAQIQICAAMLNSNRDVLPETLMQTAPSLVKHSN